MSTIFIEMPSGIAGDMLLAALIDLGGNVSLLHDELLGLGLGPIHITAKQVSVSGISARQVEVHAEQTAAWDQRMLAAHTAHHDHSHHHGQGSDHHHDHAPRLSLTGKPVIEHIHRPYRVIRELLSAAKLPDRVKQRASLVFRTLAEAEAQVHGMSVDEVEFHEVGSLDAIADIVGCCLLLDQLDIDRIISTAIMPGNGSVHCAHGRMPVPVPAVATMLARTGAPHRQIADITGELTTPTGCALITALTNTYLGPGQEMVMTSSRVGYGAGHKTILGLVNAVRVSIVSEITDQPDTVCEIRCQIDDATGEQLAVLIAELINAGARDAYLTPIIMKKGRPGYALTVLCDPPQQASMTTLILTRSSTIGVRHQQLARTILPRRMDTVSVDGHDIAIKVVTLPDGSERAKAEADQVLAVARALGMTFDDVQRAALDAWKC
jgi:pyridinium-3,5-bisthiocarboxylic acid mononucleotide nickel chelatase